MSENIVELVGQLEAMNAQMNTVTRLLGAALGRGLDADRDEKASKAG